jgi:hypothetical protein
VKIICLSCGYKVDLGDAYDDYDGLVKCFACRAMLAVKTESGTLKGVALSTAAAAVQPDIRRESGQPVPMVVALGLGRP